MKYLAYCLFASPKTLPMLKGIDGQPIEIITHQELSSAVSKIDDPERKREIPELLVYNQVIEEIHYYYTVIPLRYGSVFDTEEQILKWLKMDYTHYTALIQKLNGCVEMGIRLLLPNDCQKTTVPPSSAPTGRDYLAARKQLYLESDQLTLEQEALVESICERLSGYFKSRQKEYRSENRLLSLYFLVPKSEIEPFRQRFQEINRSESVKLLLSGPWAPYNFVGSEDSE
jgi:hypothetical protein